MQFLHSLPYNNLRGESKPGQTIAIGTKINTANFDEIVTNFLTHGDNLRLNLMVGVAMCNPKDQYNRKTGRELAISRIKPMDFKITRMISDGKKIKLLLSGEGDQVNLTVIQYRDSGKVRIFLLRMFDMLG